MILVTNCTYTIAIKGWMSQESYHSACTA